MVRIRIECIDDVVAEACLVLCKIRETSTHRRERARLDAPIEHLRNRLAAEYKRRGLSA